MAQAGATTTTNVVQFRPRPKDDDFVIIEPHEMFKASNIVLDARDHANTVAVAAHMLNKTKAELGAVKATFADDPEAPFEDMEQSLADAYRFFDDVARMLGEAAVRLAVA